MRVKSTPVSSLKQESPHFSGTRTRKKHKRLDAICEDTYNRNHAESSKGNIDNGVEGDDGELRRSSRVRRAPVILDASPPPPKKRKNIKKDVKGSGGRSTNVVSPQVVKEDEVESSEDLETPGSWKSRLRVRRKYVRFGKINNYDTKSSQRKRKLFVEMDSEGNDEKQLQRAPREEKVKVVRNTLELEVGFSVTKSRRCRRGRGKSTNHLGGEKEEHGSDLEKEHNVLDNDISDTRGDGGENIPADSEMSDENEKAITSDNDDDDDEKTITSDNDDDDDEKTITSDNDDDDDEKVITSGHDDEKAVTSSDDDDDDDGDEKAVTSNDDKAATSDDDVEVIEEEVKEVDGAVQIDEGSPKHDVVVPTEQTEYISGQIEVAAEGIPKQSHELVAKEQENRLEESSYDGKDMNSVLLVEKHMENGNSPEKDAVTNHAKESLPFSGIKGGRRCGLCGGCNDGKPPKKLELDMAESDNEACNGSSASEEPIYDTLDGFGDEPGWLGRLLGPIDDRYGIAGIWVHQHCAVWSPEVYFAGLGCLKNVRAALCRGRALKCSRCGRRGATIGCRVDRCPKTYHLPCARAVGCIFDHRKFLIACTDHRHIFQPHGSNNSIYMKQLKIKKMKQQFRKISNDACRKDIEAEEKWLENWGEDEEFLKRESKRLHRDLLRISPVYIGGTESGSKQVFHGWESVAGLQDVIRCLKEVVILPLLYPNFFDNLGITPPRGILLHGYPGTGKTLVVRALIGSIARGDKRIAYFARKGADCLGKYVGDAERQLRLLFQVAEKCQPSIIFFDEIDGLAPVRTKQQDQTHSSVVSTLLALLDGLKSRGSVVVIGATNRPDAVDPALRRPGRFDREIYFPLPSLEDRAAILSLHTQKWPKPVSEPLLGWLAGKTAGFAGADLQALCTQAAMVALKRNFPLHEVLSAAGKNFHSNDRTPLPSFSVEERDWLEALSCSPPPCSRREAGIAANDILSSPLPVHLAPCLVNPLSNLLVSLFLDERLYLPPTLCRAAAGVANAIYSAMDRRKLARDQWRFHINSIMQEANVSKEIERVLLSAGLLSGQLKCNDLTDNGCTKSDCSLSYSFSTRAGSLQNFTFSLRSKSGYRLLISGSPGSGQKHLASCILHCYIGNVEVQKVDLATASQEGHGDTVQGISRILMKCANAGSSVLFMPRIDLWAMEIEHQDINDESNYHSSEHHSQDGNVACPADDQVYKMDIHLGGTKESQDDFNSASHIWNSFVEQVESICVNTCLVIVATSAAPFNALPHRITKFFSNNRRDSGRFAHLESSLPRFSVDIDMDVNCGLVIEQSAAKISRDLIQQFVQLIHQRAHNTICKESSHSTAYCANVTNDIMKHGLPNEHAPGTQRPDDAMVKTSAVSSKRNMKGKSSLMQAILTFGYQILQYPHFAELCWVTSKLKEGPIADVNGPWKNWPFNSCIVRPDGLAEKTSGSCSPSNVKSKEKSGLVRGLVAVGLSAYRGLYSSATEVSLQIRWVLELLVLQINERIQAGKDRYQFVRILSQVSYLEDMVSSWAYSLKSLEMDAQVTSRRVLTNAASAPDSRAPHSPFSKRIDEQQAPARASTNIEVPEEVCPGFSVENTESAEMRENIVECDLSGPSETIALLEEDSPENVSLLPGAEVHKRPPHSVNANNLANKTSTECDVRNMTCELETAVNSEAVFEKSRISSQSSGSAMSNSSTPDKEGCSPAKRGTADCSNHHNVINQLSGLDLGNTRINGVPTPDRRSTYKSSFTNMASAASNSDFVCSYLCCSKCLYSLHEVMRKLLIQEWGLNVSLSVEDVHDAVASLSVELVSTLRRGYSSDNGRELSGEKQCLSIDGLNLLTCQCKKSISSLTVAEECTSHSDSGNTSTDRDDSRSSEFGLNVEFIMRNGILTTVDFDKDVTFHCKYKTFCLCPLLELVRNRSSL